MVDAATGDEAARDHPGEHHAGVGGELGEPVAARRAGVEEQLASALGQAGELAEEAGERRRGGAESAETGCQQRGAEDRGDLPARRWPDRRIRAGRGASSTGTSSGTGKPTLALPVAKRCGVKVTRIPGAPLDLCDVGAARRHLVGAERARLRSSTRSA